MTIEQVDQEIAALQQKHSVKLTEATAAGDPKQLNMTKVCGDLSIAVPILKFIKGFLFFRPAWALIVQTLIDSSGSICAQSNP